MHLTGPLSGSDDSKKTVSSEIVFIIAPAVVGIVVLAAVVIAIVAIRRKGELHDLYIYRLFHISCKIWVFFFLIMTFAI